MNNLVLKVTMRSPFLLLILAIHLSGKPMAQSDSLGVLFYNTENLFDTVNDPAKLDDDFTPSGILSYSKKRYQIKLEHTAEVINDVNQISPLSFFGLCEVENDLVLRDLLSLLWNKNLNIIHYESDDERGIDNALIYDFQKLKLIESGVKQIILDSGDRPTRPILYAVFQVFDAQYQLIVCVNHWPSRYGGQEISAPKRLIAAHTLGKLQSELKIKYPAAEFIAMGDFNDTPIDQSLQYMSDCDSGACLVNLAEPLEERGVGSYNYRGNWEMLDQFLVSSNLFHGGGMIIKDQKMVVFSEEKITYTSKEGDKSPSRTYGGKNYFGGYSDHYPIMMTIYLK